MSVAAGRGIAGEGAASGAFQPTVAAGLDGRLAALRDRLVRLGMADLERPPAPIDFSRLDPADALTNDIEGHPHAFVLACLLDRQMPSERAWRIPWLVSRKLGSFEFGVLVELEAWDWEVLLKGPPALHRLTATMAEVMSRAVRRIAIAYDGDASRIWSGTPTSDVVVRRFRAFHGAGPRIAAMATRILATHFRVPLADLRAIDVVADVHVSRVMGRLAFVDPCATPAELVRVARELSPDFPGVFDAPVWDVGYRFCHASNPTCLKCPLNDLCTYAR